MPVRFYQFLIQPSEMRALRLICYYHFEIEESEKKIIQKLLMMAVYVP